MTEPFYPLTYPPGFHAVNGLRVLAYGAGVDSTGIIAHWYESGRQLVDPIHVIAFGDTGGERGRVYQHIAEMQVWLAAHGFPPITSLTKGGRVETLEENCLRMSMLPSLAYGFKGCSQKYKIEPQDKFYNNLAAAREVWAAGQLVTKMIGYEAREVKRWSRAKKFDGKYEYEFPLVELGWNRKECLAAIKRVGLPMPGKSSCFFCPAMTLPEIRELRDEEPLLFHRALRIEAEFLAVPDRECPQCKGTGQTFARAQRPATATEQMKAALVDIDAGKVGVESYVDLMIDYVRPEPCACEKCGGTGRLAKTVKGLGRRFAWRDVDVIDIDMQEVNENERCRSCIDYAPDDDYADILVD